MQTVFLKHPRLLYAGADASGKQLLAELLGSDYLTRDICEMVTSFEDACALTGKNPNDDIFKIGTPASIALNRCGTICEALRDGELLSFSDTTKRKYYALHEYVEGLGFRFWGAGDGRAFAVAPGGSALCLPDAKRATYFGKNFIHELTPFYENK